MRIIALFLSLCLSLNVMAASGTINELERALDNYEYAITVDWDQKDQVFYEAQTVDLFQKLEKLSKEQGLLKEDILALAQKKIENKAILEAIKARVALSPKAATNEELAHLLKDISKDMYKQGATWAASRGESAMLTLIFVVVVGYTLWFYSNYECVKKDYRYECNTSSYSDGSSRTSCGYEKYCSQYEKVN